MRTTLLIGLLVCGGCSVAPTSKLGELYMEHALCIETDAMGCEHIWDEIEARERAVAEREQRLQCPYGAVSVGSAHGRAVCVPHAEVHSFIDRRLR